MSELTVRQLIEGMPLVFNASVAGDLNATLQFNVTGDEPGHYFLTIANGVCDFYRGQSDAPMLTINTPSAVWQQISQGQISGQEALMLGQYNATGDLALLMQMDSLFGAFQDGSYEQATHPRGPIQLAGMRWLTVAFVPWIFFWVTFEIPSVPQLLAVGAPLLLSLAIVGYRQRHHGSTWMERGTLGFFGVATVLTWLGNQPFLHWGSIIGTLVVGALWLGSLVQRKMPLSAEYSKWSYVQAMWRNSMFLHTNAVISLMWGWQFILAALLGMAAVLFSNLYIVLTVLRYLLLVPAFIFTEQRQKSAATTRIKNPERALAAIRNTAIAGLIVIVILIGWCVVRGA